jgi:hypothetical protein
MTEEQIKRNTEEEQAQSEMVYRTELKHYTAMMLSGIKGNTSRSTNGKKDVDYVKECTRLSMLMINYINHLPLNFKSTEEEAPPKPAEMKVSPKPEATNDGTTPETQS